METAQVTLRQASNAAKKIGRYLSQENMLTLGQDRAGVPSLADHAKQVLQKIIHSAYPDAEEGKPKESVGEQNRLNLAQAIRNFFGLFVSKKNSVYEESETQKATKKTQRALDYQAGIEKLKNAEVTEIKHIRNDDGKTFFTIATNNGEIDFFLDQNMFEPFNSAEIKDPKKFIRNFVNEMDLCPDRTFKVNARYHLKSGANILWDTSIKIFTYLKNNIKNCKDKIDENFETFKTNVDLILEGLKNARAVTKS